MSGATRQMTAKIHVARKQLGLDEDGYRAALERAAGKKSVKDMTAPEMERVLAEMARLGFRAAPKVSGKPWVRKIYAIWADLKPFLDAPTDAALNAFVARQTRTVRAPRGIDNPEWLTATDATKVIQGLEGWLARERAKREAA